MLLVGPQGRRFDSDAKHAVRMGIRGRGGLSQAHHPECQQSTLSSRCPALETDGFASLSVQGRATFGSISGGPEENKTEVEGKCFRSSNPSRKGGGGASKLCPPPPSRNHSCSCCWGLFQKVFVFETEKSTQYRFHPVTGWAQGTTAVLERLCWSPGRAWTARAPSALSVRPAGGGGEDRPGQAGAGFGCACGLGGRTPLLPRSQQAQC